MAKSFSLGQLRESGPYDPFISVQPLYDTHQIGRMVRMSSPTIARFVVALGLLFTILLSPACAEDPAAGNLPRVIGARLSMTADRARLILDLTAPSEFAIVSLDSPDRIAIDVKAADVGFAKPTAPAGTGGLVADYGVDMAEPGRARATLMLEHPAQVQQAYMLQPFADQPARLVVDLIPMTPDDFAKKVAADLAASRANALSAKAPVAREEVARSQTRPLIVIDPGHGGIDSGARGPKGTMEKDLVLQFALKLQDLLVKSGRFDVALTRADDSYLTLEERVNLARQNRADLFVSIHADTFEEAGIRGFSVYTRDENATDMLDKVLADHENHVDIIGSYVKPDPPSQVVDLLVDLMRRQTRREAYLAAEDIVQQVEPAIDMRKYPVRKANFFVLQAPDVPSILIELGFLSNAQDMANLKEMDWQERAAQAVTKGIDAYFDDLDIPTHLASQ